MAETFHAEQSSFRPGKKLPLLGIDLQTTNGWVRWGLPFASGVAAGMAMLAIVLGHWLLS